MGYRTDIEERRSEIQGWINEQVPKAVIARRLACDIKTLGRYLDQWGLDYAGNRGWRTPAQVEARRMPLVEYLKGSPKSSRIREKLIEEGYKERRCENCGLDDWQGGEIPLELNHRDGNKYNNVLENFEILCPNCHALTPTWRGRNVGSYDAEPRWGVGKWGKATWASRSDGNGHTSST